MVNQGSNLKVLFINPYHVEWTNTLPLGIAYLAATLRNKGYEVSVIDASANDLGSLEIVRKIQGIRPDIVGVTASTPQIYDAWKILEKTKMIDQRIMTILGGVHPTSLPTESLSHEFVDFVFRGESEETIVEFMEAIGDKKNFKEIEGLSYKENGQIIHNPRRRLISDLDQLPYPARDLFPFPDKYYSPFMLKRKYATILTSRGCPGGCLFCNKNTFGFLFRARSAESVVDEMEYLMKTYKIEEFHIADDCFTWDVDRVFEICKNILKKDLKIKWACSNGIRVDRGSKEMFEIMKRAGCYRISFGIESGDDEVLRKMGKRINLQQVRMAFENAQKVGMFTVALFMLGNYGENEQTMQKTINFSKSLKTDYAQFTITVPYPGTALFKIIERQGKFLTRDWSRYGIFDEPVVFELHEIKRNLLLKMYKKAYRGFYYRPSQIFFILKKRSKYLGVRDLKQVLESAKRVLYRTFAKTIHEW